MLGASLSNVSIPRSLNPSIPQSPYPSVEVFMFVSRWWLVLLVGLLLPVRTLASGCGFYGYKSYGGYSSSYSYGKSYWGGGYWNGGGGYRAGYYAPGYYKSYYYEQPVFVKYQAVIPVVALPTYGAYYHEQGAAPAPQTSVAPTLPPPSPSPSPGYASNGAAGYRAPTQSPPPHTSNCGPDAAAKLDRVLSVVTETSVRMSRLESRVEVLEGGRRLPPGHAPVPPRQTPAQEPPPPSSTPPPPPPTPHSEPPSEKDPPSKDPGKGSDPDDVPTLLNTHCASCHESKVSAKMGGRLTLFVNTARGPQMAGLDKEGKVVPLSLAVLKKLDQTMEDGTMPPEYDTAGKPIPQLTAAQKGKVRQFLRPVLANAPAPTRREAEE